MSKNEIKYYSKLKQKKYRETEGLFLIEGNNLIEECLKSPVYRELIIKVFVRNDYSNPEFISTISSSHPHIEIIYTDAKGITSLSETVNSQGIIGIVNKPDDRAGVQSTNSKSNGNLIVLLESISDPGNLGTILRTCHWYGVDKVFLSNDSVDIYNSKVLRSSQGAVFHLNIKSDADASGVTEKFYKDNFEILLTDLKAEEYISEIKFNETDNYFIVFGNESKGISRSILEKKDYKRVKIRGYSGCESLNIAVSAGIILDRIRSK